MGSAGLLDGTERTRYPNNQKNHSYTPERPASAGPLPIDRGAPTLHKNAARNAPIRRMGSAGLLDGTERTRYPNNQKNHSYTPERPASAGPLPIDRGAPTLHKNAARNAPSRRMGSAGLLDGTDRTRSPNHQKPFIHAREARFSRSSPD